MFKGLLMTYLKQDGQAIQFNLFDTRTLQDAQKNPEKYKSLQVRVCGYVSRSALEQALPYTDVFLYDLKAIDEQVHIRCTGKSNRQILENLQYLDSCGANLVIRVPFVPGYNDGEMPKIREFLDTLTHVSKVELLPYHNFAGSKYDALGMENTMPQDLPTKEQLKQAEKELRIVNRYSP